MPGRECRATRYRAARFWFASAAIGPGGAGKPLLGAWTEAGSVFRQRVWRGLVSSVHCAYAFLLSLLAHALVWGQQPNTAGSARGLQGAAREARIVRARAQHR